jgi:DNA-binding MarR family transcriptional regulator
MTLYSLRCSNNENTNKAKTMVAKMTERQGQYLAFISQYMKVNGRSPAESDIQRYFGVSPPTVHQMVLKLESLGLIRRKPGVARSIQVMVSPDDIPALK